jgi:hypothetical protein
MEFPATARWSLARYRLANSCGNSSVWKVSQPGRSASRSRSRPVRRPASLPARRWPRSAVRPWPAGNRNPGRRRHLLGPVLRRDQQVLLVATTPVRLPARGRADPLVHQMTGVEIPITMLFADIRGSTAMGERMRPADVPHVPTTSSPTTLSTMPSRWPKNEPTQPGEWSCAQLAPWRGRDSSEHPPLPG